MRRFGASKDASAPLSMARPMPTMASARALVVIAAETSFGFRRTGSVRTAAAAAAAFCASSSHRAGIRTNFERGERGAAEEFRRSDPGFAEGEEVWSLGPKRFDRHSVLG